MTPETLLIAVALILALISELQSEGKSFIGWAVAFVAIALLWGRLG